MSEMTDFCSEYNLDGSAICRLPHRHSGSHAWTLINKTAPAPTAGCGEVALTVAAAPASEAGGTQEPQGTFACPLCGQTTPHGHDQWDVERFRAAGKCPGCEAGTKMWGVRGGPWYHRYYRELKPCYTPRSFDGQPVPATPSPRSSEAGEPWPTCKKCGAPMIQLRTAPPFPVIAWECHAVGCYRMRVTHESGAEDATWMDAECFCTTDETCKYHIALASLTAIQQRESGCPCLLTTPCSPSCTCAHPELSGGCLRCCQYGSEEQRRAMAEHLTALQQRDAALVQFEADWDSLDTDVDGPFDDASYRAIGERLMARLAASPVEGERA